MLQQNPEPKLLPRRAESLRPPLARLLWTLLGIDAEPQGNSHTEGAITFTLTKVKRIDGWQDGLIMERAYPFGYWRARIRTSAVSTIENVRLSLAWMQAEYERASAMVASPRLPTKPQRVTPLQRKTPNQLLIAELQQIARDAGCMSSDVRLLMQQIGDVDHYSHDPVQRAWYVGEFKKLVAAKVSHQKKP